jgi:hypothetical protein
LRTIILPSPTNITTNLQGTFNATAKAPANAPADTRNLVLTKAPDKEDSVNSITVCIHLLRETQRHLQG